MWQLPFAPQDEAERQRRLDAQDIATASRSRWLLVGGVLALVAFAVLAIEGLPGTGVILVPIGLGMILGGGIELLLNH
jgi:hypothetical protein